MVLPLNVIQVNNLQELRKLYLQFRILSRLREPLLARLLNYYHRLIKARLQLRKLIIKLQTVQEPFLYLQIRVLYLLSIKNVEAIRINFDQERCRSYDLVAALLTINKR